MKKHLTIPVDFALREYVGQSVFQIRLQRKALSDWCLGLCLLKSGLVEALAVTEELGSHTIEVQVLGMPDRAAKALADFTPATPQIKLPPIQLDYILSFFLKYFRDGVAQVDHIDVEAIATGTKSQDAYITVTVPDFAPPLSQDELSRRFR